MKNIHNYLVRTAIDYADITAMEVRDIFTRQDGTLVEINFCTDWMHYICYADLSGEVFGFMSEPLPIRFSDPADEYIHARCA